MATHAKLTLTVNTIYQEPGGIYSSGAFVLILWTGSQYRTHVYMIGTAANQWLTADKLYQLVSSSINDLSHLYTVTRYWNGITIEAKKLGIQYNLDQSYITSHPETSIDLTFISNQNDACSLNIFNVTKTDYAHEGEKGSITVNVNGFLGTPEYSIDGTTWRTSNTFTGLMAGTYTVRVRDSAYAPGECTRTQSVTIGTQVVYQATRNHTVFCGGYYEGSYTASATAYSTISQQDANNKASAEASRIANENLVCTLKENLFRPAKMNNKSFTLSYSFLMPQPNWASFHDFTPDHLFSSRSSMLSFKEGKLYKHNKGAYGEYYTNEKKPFFIDFVINNEKGLTKILDTVMWMAETVIGDKEKKGPGFEKIMIWNNFSASGEINIDEKESYVDLNASSSDVEGMTIVNQFSDMVIDPNKEFVSNLANDYLFVESNLYESRSWFNEQLMSGKYFIVRLFYSNSKEDTAVRLLEASASISPSYS